VDQAQLQEYVGELAAEEGLPGAVVAVSHGGQRLYAAAGIANANTGAAMTPDTGFLLGSIGKVWVTTLVMKLVEAGRLTLDATVRNFLPELRLADDGAAETLTVRQLLTHTSGIDGADYCPDDLGSGDDAVAKYVDSLADVGQLYPQGELWSYCNPGFVIAGRVIEVVTGRPFSRALREELLEPLGLARTLLSAEEAILWPAAVGHFPDLSGGPTRATGRYLLPPAMSPAGTTLTTTLDDALTFADLHLGRGKALVSSESIAAMAARHVDLPVPGLGSFGLGWGRTERAGTVVLSHGGGSLGGLAQLVVVPTADLALVAFGNSALAAGFMAKLTVHVLTSFGVPPSSADPDPGPAASPERFTGVFHRREFETTISVEGEDLVVQTVPDPTNAVLRAYGASTPTEVRCRPSGPRSFSLPPSSSGAVASAAGFLVGEDYLYTGGRLSRRVSGS
jgi:CubicO group peptidase (beta-lactamase class C family)